MLCILYLFTLLQKDHFELKVCKAICLALVGDTLGSPLGTPSTIHRLTITITTTQQHSCMLLLGRRSAVPATLFRLPWLASQDNQKAAVTSLHVLDGTPMHSIHGWMDHPKGHVSLLSQLINITKTTTKQSKQNYANKPRTMKLQLLTSTALTMVAFSAIALPTTSAKGTISANTERLRGAHAAGPGQDQTDTLERLLQSSSSQNGAVDCQLFNNALDYWIQNQMQQMGSSQWAQFTCNEVTANLFFKPALREPVSYFSRLGKYAECAQTHFLHGLQEMEDSGSPLLDLHENINIAACQKLLADWADEYEASADTTGNTNNGSRRLAPCKGACVVVAKVVGAGVAGGATAAIELGLEEAL